MIYNGFFNVYSVFLVQMLFKLRKGYGSINRIDVGLEEVSGCEDKDDGQDEVL